MPPSVESIGYAVFAEQDQKSRKKLDALNSESITLAGDTEALQAALTEANKRLLAAQNAKSVEEDRADAMEARRIFHEELAENGKRLDEAMQILVAESHKQVELFRPLRVLGVEAPNERLTSVRSGLALSTAIMGTPWQKQIESKYLSPGEKTTFEKIHSEWAVSIQRQIARRLGEDQQTKAA